MATIIYTPEKEYPFPRKAAISIDGVLIEPGEQTITGEALQKILTFDNLASYQEYGALIIKLDESESLPAEPTSEPEESLTPKRSRRKKEELVEDTSSLLTSEEIEGNE